MFSKGSNFKFKHKKLILVLCYQLCLCNVWGAPFQISIDLEDVQVNDSIDSGVLILGQGHNINISENLEITNEENPNQSVILTQGDLGSTTINIAKNSSIRAWGDQTAIDLKNSLNVGQVTILNYGEILKMPEPHLDLGGIGKGIDFTGSVANLYLQNYGLIIGDVNGSVFSDRIDNYGVITGTLDGGEGNDTLNFYGGRLQGVVDGGTGNNKFNVYANFTSENLIRNMQNIENFAEFTLNHPVTNLNKSLFNRGIFNLNSQVLGEGIIANEPEGIFYLRGGYIGNGVDPTIGFQEFNNSGKALFQVQLPAKLKLNDFNNCANGEAMVITLGSGVIEIQNLYNTAFFHLHNNVTNGISINRTNNLATAELLITNTTGDPNDLNLGAFLSNAGTLNINGAAKISAEDLVNTGIIKFDSPLFYNPTVDLGANKLINQGKVMVYSPTVLDGDYQMDPGSEHMFYLSNSISGHLQVNGRVDLGGGDHLLNILSAEDYVFSPKDPIVVISGREIATEVNENTLKITTPAVALKYMAVNQDNQIQLIGSRIEYNELITPIENSINNIVVAKIVHGLIEQNNVDDQFKQELAKIDNLNSVEAVSVAIDQLVPDVNLSQPSQISLSNVGLILNKISDRINTVARLDLPELTTGYVAGDELSLQPGWFKVFGATNHQKALTESFGYRANTKGLTFGLDNLMLRNLVGLAVSYTHSYAKTKDLVPDHIRSNHYQLNVYGTYDGTYNNLKYYVDGFMGINWVRYNSTRIYVPVGAALGTAATQHKANFNGIQPSLKGVIGIPLHWKDLKITPYGSLFYNYLYQNKYSEVSTGGAAGGAALVKVAAKSLHLLEGGLGIKCEMLKVIKNIKFIPEIHFMTLYDIIRTRSLISTQFQAGGSAFTLRSDQPHRSTFNAGAGITYINQQDLQLVLNYDLHVKRKFVGHSGSLLIKYIL